MTASVVPSPVGLAGRAVDSDVYCFGPFRFDAVRRELADGRGPVRVGSRALQLLEVLLSSPGRLFAREELVARVWPSTVVEETSLRVHLSALRRVLGDGRDGARYVVNVPGRGYAFVGELRSEPQASESPVARQKVLPADGPVPARPAPGLTRPIGRDGVIARIGESLTTQRLVSIVGVGGIGKTTVALAVAQNLAKAFAQGCFFVNLAVLNDPTLVVVEVAQSCGLDIARGEPWVALEGVLQNRQALIVLDNCEHLIDAVARLVDRLLRSCPRLRVLATSREPLDLEAEWQVKLPPLGVPAAEQPLSPEAVLAYPAVQLFVERAGAACGSFRLSADNVETVRQICAALDGIPLAIELAAARINLLGERGLLHRLENALDLLTRGRRTAIDRHQTLHAVLNWSYELLDETERLVLQRLSVFRGSFDLDGAAVVACCAELPRQAVVAGVLSLCEKSLVTSEAAGDGTATHRLLFITRLFAERALAARPDAAAVHRRHAVFVLGILEEANRTQAALRNYRSKLSRASVVADLRAALAWTLLQENDLVLGMQIIAEPRSMYMAADLIDECQRHVVFAVGKIEQAGVAGTRLELKLQKQLTYISGQALGNRQGQVQALARTRELVDRYGSIADKLEALYGMLTAAYGQGDYLQSLAFCEEVRELAQGEFAPLSVALGDRMAALNLHALGRHDAAERLVWRVMEVDDSALPWNFLSNVPFAVSMRIQLARIQWLRGDFRQAWATVQELLPRQEGAHVHAYCQPLGMAAIPLALWKGERPSAAAWTAELLEHATGANLPYWLAFGKVFAAVLDGRPMPSDSAEARVLDQSTQLMDIHTTLQPAPPHAATLARVQAGEVGWCAPEVLRLAALAGLDAQDAASRERCLAALGEAFELSAGQGARFWSLRIAISLAEVASVGSAERVAALGLLRSLLAQIDDGSAIPDLVRARGLAGPPSAPCRRALFA